MKSSGVTGEGGMSARVLLLALTLCVAPTISYASGPLIRIDGGGGWALREQQWQPIGKELLRSHSQLKAVNEFDLPRLLDDKVEACAAVKYCDVEPMSVAGMTGGQAHARASGSRFKVASVGELLLVSRVGGEKEAEVIASQQVPNVLLGRLGLRFAVNQEKRVVYTFMCDAAYECRLIARGFDGSETVGSALNLKVVDLLFYRQKLFVLYAKPSSPGDEGKGGLLGAFGHGRYKEAWAVAAVDQLSKLTNETILARQKINGVGYFYQKLDSQ